MPKGETELHSIRLNVRVSSIFSCKSIVVTKESHTDQSAYHFHILVHATNASRYTFSRKSGKGSEFDGASLDVSIGRSFFALLAYGTKEDLHPSPLIGTLFMLPGRGTLAGNARRSSTGSSKRGYQRASRTHRSKRSSHKMNNPLNRPASGRNTIYSYFTHLSPIWTTSFSTRERRFSLLTSGFIIWKRRFSSILATGPRQQPFFLSPPTQPSLIIILKGPTPL